MRKKNPRKTSPQQVFHSETIFEREEGFTSKKEGGEYVIAEEGGRLQEKNLTPLKSSKKLNRLRSREKSERSRRSP